VEDICVLGYFVPRTIQRGNHELRAWQEANITTLTTALRGIRAWFVATYSVLSLFSLSP